MTDKHCVVYNIDYGGLYNMHVLFTLDPNDLQMIFPQHHYTLRFYSLLVQYSKALSYMALSCTRLRLADVHFLIT